MRVVKQIDWSSPGENRYVGSISKAIDSYTDIPQHIRNILIERSNNKQYTEIVDIDVNGIWGKSVQYFNLRQMFFGVNIRAETVVRNEWQHDLVVRGFIYVEQGFCILIPFVCGNVSRVDVGTKTNQPTVEQFKPITKIYSVPEASSLSLSIAALTAAFIVKRRNQNVGR